MIKLIIKLNIQEIISDFYSLGEEEGYISGLADGFELSEKNKNDYHNFMINLIDKYIPFWKDKIKDVYWNSNEDDEKGIILSSILYDNFKKIFYELI